MFRNINLDQFLKVWERKVSNWVLKNRHKVFLFLFIAGVLAILPSLPYVNLIFPRPLQIFLTLFLLLLIFNISQRNIIFLAVILLLFAIPVLLLGEIDSADLIGDFVYGIVFLCVLKFILDKDH